MDPSQIERNKSSRELLYRAVCEQFAQKMAARLNAHAHVGNFLEWSPTEMELLGEIQHRLGILGHRTNREYITADCADIANMLLRYSQLYGQ